MLPECAESLEGGNFAWRDTGLPLIPVKKVPPLTEAGTTLWVTRHRPKVDRIACPWLIRRFIDPRAQFLFVPPAEVLEVAEKFNATPFDVEGVHWSHRGENGEFCTFDTMIEEWQIRSDALDRLAVLVRGADTDRHDLAPEAAGLLAAVARQSRWEQRDNQDENLWPRRLGCCRIFVSRSRFLCFLIVAARQSG